MWPASSIRSSRAERLDCHRSITATDVYSAYTWAELRTTPKNPSARWTSALARRLAADLHARGIRLERIMTDNASEFRAESFQDTLLSLGVRHTFIHAGRPQTNGCVERVQGTILQECWKPAFARYLVVKLTGLQREPAYYLRYYNEERPHRGRHTKGRAPIERCLPSRPSSLASHRCREVSGTGQPKQRVAVSLGASGLGFRPPAPPFGERRLRGLATSSLSGRQPA